MPRRPAPISKSKFLAGLQCEKLLWYNYNAKEKIPPPDAQTQAVFDQGHEVGEFARWLFPDGIEVAKGLYPNYTAIVQQSQKALHCRQPLFEAGFRFDNAIARADILEPADATGWNIIEVKSSTEVKSEHLHDVAFQRHVYEGAGLTIRECYILHINRDYVRQGPIEPEKLFRRVEVTDQVALMLPGIAARLTALREVITSTTCPPVPIGPQCHEPYDCPLVPVCWDFLPDNNVLTLYRMGQKGFDLLKDGIVRIADLPPDYRLSDTQQIQIDALRSGRPFVDKAAIRSFLDSLEYPLYFLDLETISMAVPIYDVVRPYEQVPFQYSLHVTRSANDGLEHHHYLADGATDPRPEILRQLSTLLGECGSIIIYNASFEKSRLRDASAVYGEYEEWYSAIEPRIIDLYVPFRSFHYYHPRQQGKTSIKAVYPAITGNGYDELAIDDGSLASNEYLRITFGQVTAGEKTEVRRQLEEYCTTDTRAMVEIVESLRELSG